MVFCAGHVDRRAFFLLAVAFSFFAIAPVAAQEPRAEQSNVLHFAFASQVGSGVYAVNDRTVQIYRIPVGVRLPEVDPGWGWKLTLPVTLGFFDFEPQDFLAADVREHLSTVSFVPGLRFELPVRENIRLEPFAEGGMAWDLSGDTRTWVYAMGLASEIKFPWHDLDGRLGNRLQRRKSPLAQQLSWYACHNSSYPAISCRRKARVSPLSKEQGLSRTSRATHAR